MSIKPLKWNKNGKNWQAIGAGIVYSVTEFDNVVTITWVNLIKLHNDAPRSSDGKTYTSYSEAMDFVNNTHYPHFMSEFVERDTLKGAITALADACHGASVKGGWWHDIHTGEPLERNKLEMIALIHSEISEAVEGVRKGINDDHLPQFPMETVEMADALVRIFDYIGGHGLDVANALPAKLGYNANRADHKPENRLKDGGKKY